MNQESYEYEPHNFKKRKRFPWLVCNNCGLVTLGNKFTEWAIGKGCDNRYHPSYANVKYKFTHLF